MHLKPTVALVFILLLAATTASASVTVIADARALSLGSTVTVEGVVTVPSGVFAASTFDQGFALQDETAGIYVSIADNPGLDIGHRVRVTGELADDGFNQLVLRPGGLSDVEVLYGEGEVEAEEVATGDVSEATEGLLVEVEGIVTREPTDDLPFGYSVFIDDGTGETQIFIPATTGVNPFNIPFIEVGRKLEATGFGSQFLAQYEVLPRFLSDLEGSDDDDDSDSDSDSD
jgi:DNA/RNA endonuclease YhcR with UshA esterase domain